MAIRTAIEQPVGTYIKAVNIFVLIFMFTFAANGQQKDSIQSNDSSENKSYLYDSEILLHKPLFLHSTPLGIIQPDSIGRHHPDLLQQSLTIPLPFLSWSLENNLGIESTWKLEISRQEEYKTWKTIMTSVQMSTVAYLTYLHLKKYGLK
jgi:hypothetical protein